MSPESTIEIARATLVVMLLTLPMIGHALSDFTRVVSDHIVNG